VYNKSHAKFLKKEVDKIEQFEEQQ